MKILDVIAIFLVLLGALNWGTVGVADFNALMWIFIAMSKVQHAIYTLTGLSAIWIIVFHKGIHRRWYEKK